MDLKIFADTNLFEAGTSFFKQLNIRLNSHTTTPLHLKDILKDKFKSQEIFEKVSAAYFLGLVDQSVFDDNMSLFEDEKISYEQAGKKIYVGYEGMMIFAVQIKGIDSPTRTQLSDLTRAFNRASKSLPVVVLFQYGNFITLATSERTKYKQTWREGEKIGKISLLKDIDILNPHTGHIKILNDLVLKLGVRDFSGLYQQWREVFDVQLLNRNFYKELSSWYFWALRQVEFPDDAEKNKEIRNSTSVIRLITRLIFVWFLKEKRLVPEILFNKKALDAYLKYDDIKNSTYYKAILQNLFFATLNTKMKKDDKESRKFVNRQYGVQVFYRYERYFKDKKKALKLFEAIPFLNGGLFENLDKNIGKDNEIRIDCFSNRPVHEKKLKVPDCLFFGDKIEIDLSKELGSKKRKKETVRGLIHILNSYKFTIDENTPIEEEIALDPELLGKVFENLLASYNPETQTTARKQTGSFYTPREIVNYMVDESLKASLSNLVSKKIDHTTEDDIKTGLDILFEYTEKEHAFTDNEVSKIVEAISELKILDPACGSGAFPMGILHKLVFILNKIDGDNKKWRDLQKQRAVKETEKAYSVGDKEERHQRLKEIEEAFDFNTSDYGRKLFLIENSIYGVDIQPIAVQIAKLRFFISLIVDQNTDEDKENLGILPLPNLETKFVAANTLIGIDKKGQLELNFQNSEIDKKEKELSKVRERHFLARTPKTKEKYREKDEYLRNEIAVLLEKEGFASDVTKKLAHWNPYDQNTSADFFDPEWMFGLKDGFDVVIGNPPYFSLNTINKEFVVSLANRYKSIHTGYNDIVYYFIYIGIELLNPNGFCIFITSNYYLGNNYAKKLREYLKKHVIKIVNFKDHQVFSEASIHTCITCSSKKLAIEKILFFESTDDLQIDSSKIETSLQAFEIDRNELKHDWIIADENKLTLINKLNDGCYKLGDISIIEKGSTSGKNEVFTVSYRFAKVNLFEKEILKKNIKNADISRYSIQDRGNYLIYTDKNTIIEDYPNIYSYLSTHKPVLSSRNEVKKGLYPWYRLERPRKKYIFDASEKIVVPYRSETNKFAYDNQQYFNDGGDIRAIVLTEKGLDIKFILALLNSKVLDWLYGFIGKPKGKSREYFNKPMSIIPIKTANYNEQKSLISLVDNILNTKQSNLALATTALEAEIDGRVAHLYNLTEEEYSLILKETNCTDLFRTAALNIYRDIARGKIK